MAQNREQRRHPEDHQTGARLVGYTPACARLGVGRTTLWRLVTSGQISSAKIGKRRLILESSIDSFIARQVAEQVVQ